MSQEHEIDSSPESVKTGTLYIAGAGRSGTTLVDRLIGESDGVSSLGEVALLWERGFVKNEFCGCGERFGDCPFWQEVGVVAFGGWTAELVDAALSDLNAVGRSRYFVTGRFGLWSGQRRERARAYGVTHARVLAAARQVAGARIVVDSSKHPALAFVLTKYSSVDPQILHVVRDPRGVAYSWSRVVARGDAGRESEEMARYSPSRSAARWVMANFLTTLLKHGGRYARVKYEDVVADPVATIQRVGELLQLAPLSGPKLDGDRRVDFGVQHTVAGNPSRMKREAVQIQLDEGWRMGMSDRARKTVSLLTTPLRQRFGY